MSRTGLALFTRAERNIDPTKKTFKENFSFSLKTLKPEVHRGKLWEDKIRPKLEKSRKEDSKIWQNSRNLKVVKQGS